MLTKSQLLLIYGQDGGAVARLAVLVRGNANLVGLLTLLAWGSRFAIYPRGVITMNKLIPIAGTRMCEYKYVAPRSISSKIITVVKTLARDCFIAIGVRHG